MAEVPEILQSAQSFTFDIKNEKDGKFAVLTFFALPNGVANPENKVMARFALPYELLVAMPRFIQDLIRLNNERFPNK